MKSTSNDNEPVGKEGKASGASGASKPGDRKCPICEAAAQERYAPFCSRRCANIDLSRWMQGHYVIEGSDSAHGEEEEPG